MNGYYLAKDGFILCVFYIPVIHKFSFIVVFLKITYQEDKERRKDQERIHRMEEEQ